MPDDNATPDNGQPEQYWLDHREHRNRTHEWRRASKKEGRRERLLQDWYGSDLARGIKLERHRPARKLGDSVDSVLRRVVPRNMVLIEELQENWASVVGGDNARYSKPVRINENVLEVEVVNPSWMYVLSTVHAANIKNAVSDFTEGKVKDVRFRPQGKSY